MGRRFGRIELKDLDLLRGDLSTMKRANTTWPESILRSPIIRSTLLVVLSCGMTAQTSKGNAADDPAADDPAAAYETGIKPVLRERCYACHGALKQESGLRLDTATLAIKGGDSGAAVVPSQPDASLLLQRISESDPSSRMPPEGEPLKPAEIERIRHWIAAGASFSTIEEPERDPRSHWSFQPPVRPAVPTASEAMWNQNPIDAFLAAEHQKLSLTPQPPADRRILLRRLYLDLIGLPPTYQEQNEFLAKSNPEAYEEVVSRLLNSPQHGERWGRHWMDVWRYSDWWGLGAEVRNSQKHIRHWRDWIIESVNEDKGYDQMLREMLAADELYPDDLSRLRATGFLARQYFKFNRTTWLDSTIEHTSKAMLGLTYNCCKCHDHKYDPISQKDYYQLRAIFEPYQVRTEFVAGQLNPEIDGIPRAYDGNADAKTFLHLRGDDRNPDLTAELAPRIPGFLQFEPWSITPITLPTNAAQPGLRPHILQSHLQRAAQQISEAQSALLQARQMLSDFERTANTAASADVAATEPPSESDLTLSDSFDLLNPERWQPIRGDWICRDGKLIQQRNDGAQGMMRLKTSPPQDFELTVHCTTTGGQKWKSIGVSFDVTETDDVMAYLSAVDPGAKSQITYKKAGRSIYPPEAAKTLAVPLNVSHKLTVRVRGTLVNFLINDQLTVAYRLPVARVPGPIQLVTYDATAEFDDFSMTRLRRDVPMAEADKNGKPTDMPETRDSLQLAVVVAEKALAAAESQPATLRARDAAARASADGIPSAEATRLAQEATRWERTISLARAAEAVARAELAVLRAAPDKKSEAEQKLTSARMMAEGAQKAAESPGSEFTPLDGALKTLESNLETEESRRKPFPTISTGRRTAFAAWLTNKKNPLPARVAVNHIWMRHMGRPLVSTVFDFGRKGTPPTHPELLDWLAVELVESGWSMKHIHRLIVTSQAYRMTSSAAAISPTNSSGDLKATSAEIDPENRYYWRTNTVRMEAQVVRDSLLHLAGELDLTMGGPSIPVTDETTRRRSLYFVHSHNEHQKFLSIFDDANVLDCYRRDESIVPQQALALENSALASEMAATIERRISADLTASDPDSDVDESFLRIAFETVLAATPNSDELSIAREGLSRIRAAAQERNVPDATEVARQALIQTLLNHNDFVTIR